MDTKIPTETRVTFTFNYEQLKEALLKYLGIVQDGNFVCITEKFKYVSDGDKVFDGIKLDIVYKNK